MTVQVESEADLDGTQHPREGGEAALKIMLQTLVSAEAAITELPC